MLNPESRVKWSDVDLEAKLLKFNNTKEMSLSNSLVELLKNMGPERSGCVFKNTKGEQYKQAPTPFKGTVKKLGLNEGRNDKITFGLLEHVGEFSHEQTKHLLYSPKISLCCLKKIFEPENTYESFSVIADLLNNIPKKFIFPYDIWLKAFGNSWSNTVEEVRKESISDNTSDKLFSLKAMKKNFLKLLKDFLIYL